MNNFLTSGNLAKKKPGNGPATVATAAANVEKAKKAVDENPNISVRDLAQHLRTSYGSAQKILKIKLSMHAYKVKICQKLQPTDFERRMQFCEWFLEKLDADNEFIGKLIMSDEAHFNLSGCVNRQNLRFWSTENPMEIMEMPLHSERVTVWCGFTENAIIGPFFFEDGNGQTTTVNGERYGEMLNEYFIPAVDGMDLVDPFFQQDGATCHTTRDNMSILRTRFPGQLISRFGDIEWPARSPDLSPLDFFLWGYLKERVYRGKPTTLTQLKEAIESEIRSIDPAMTAAVMQTMRKRAQSCIDAKGHHLKNIIFKK